MIAVTPPALAAATAVAGIGEARFTEIVAMIGRGNRFANEALISAREAGLVIQTGKPGTINARWVATEEGQGIVRGAMEAFDRQQDASSREAILAIVRREGVIPTGRKLAQLLRRESSSHGSLGQHSINHQLHSMVKAGLLEARTVRNGNTQGLVDIRLGDSPWHEQTAAVPAAEVVVVSSWPELERLRQWVDTTETERQRSARLIEAADLLIEADPDEAERLLARAAEVAPAELSPAELEYLRFAAAHTQEDGS